MLDIKKTYVTDENNQTLAVQIDIKTYAKIEQMLEDYALGKLIEESDPDEDMSVEEAKSYYDRLEKD